MAALLPDPPPPLAADSNVVTSIPTPFAGVEVNVSVVPETEYADLGCRIPPTETIVWLILRGEVESVKLLPDPFPV
jgi:hypothetical protein